MPTDETDPNTLKNKKSTDHGLPRSRPPKRGDDAPGISPGPHRRGPDWPGAETRHWYPPAGAGRSSDRDRPGTTPAQGCNGWGRH